MPAQHQWLVDPTAILVRPHTALTLCTEPRCPKVARYLLQFPRQDAVAYCHPHTKAAIRRATGQDQDLRTMLARTRQADQHPTRRPRQRHVHWPEHKPDETMETPGGIAFCGLYVPARYLAERAEDVTCLWCKKQARRRAITTL